MRTRRWNAWLALTLAAALAAATARADSVAQIQTGKNLTRESVILLDPQGNPGAVPGESDTAAEVGDILTFRFRFTPVPNGALRGMGGYITDYIPPNTEVVGARIVNADGNTLAPAPGGFTHDGWESRGSRAAAYSTWGLEDGSLVQLYCDTGLFFTTDPLLARVPADDFLRIDNGIVMDPEPTGAGQLKPIMEYPPGVDAHAHNLWDWVQAMAFGTGGGIGPPPGGDVNTNGTGNTPHRYGSAVAGPDAWYGYDAVETAPGVIEPAVFPDDPGPWLRIAYPGSTTCTGGPATSADGPTGESLRVGVPTTAGWDLHPDNPLPAGAIAVRYAVGELVVGEEYWAEIALRVLDLPLDPVQGADVNCAEVFGGDASEPQSGKDNPWRYFVPAPACVQLNLFFDLTVDQVLAVAGDTLTYTIEGKNLSLLDRTGVVVTFVLDAALTFVSATGSPTVAGSLVTWDVGTMLPGDEFLYTVDATVGGGGLAVVSRATFTSDDIPGGFTVATLTNIDEMALFDMDMVAAPMETTAGGTTTYTLTIANVGTGDATCGGGGCEGRVTLPGWFTVTPGTATLDGAAAADPTLVGTYYSFALAVIPAGATSVLAFGADIALGTPPGVYTSDVQVFFDAGQSNTEDARLGVAPVAVDVVWSDAPAVDAPILAGDTCVSGTTGEPDGTIITVYVDGIARGTTTATAGTWEVCGIPSLYAGQEVWATAAEPGEMESAPSESVFVSGTTGAACDDGEDNDGDGLVDYPDDPGCDSASDPDETDVPECSDFADNDSDGAADYPDDPGCCSYADDDESDDGACPEPPACANGEDDDGDGLTDYPADPGCDSSLDDDEADVPPAPDGGEGESESEAESEGEADAGVPNLGGVPAPGGAAGGGCGCSVGARP